MNYFDALQWRYATKRMTGEKVPKEKRDKIFKAIRMAPTSTGLQPFNVIHIEDQELREKIRPVAYDQPQITESSDLLVFAAWNEITPERIDRYIELTSEIRDVDQESLDQLRDMVEGIASRDLEDQRTWSDRQAYIALGFGLSAAAIEEVDASPMEGFNNEELDELLDLSSQGLHSIALMALGYRDEENDWLEPMEKVRRPKDELFLKPNVSELV